MRDASRILGGALAALLFAAGARATEAPTVDGAGFNQAQAQLLAIDLAIPMCTDRFPDIGGDLQAARRDWTAGHAEVEAAYQAKLSANPEATGLVREKLVPVVTKAIADVGGAVCREFAATLRQPGGLDRMSFDTAVGAYYQNIVGMRLLAGSCVRLHPALREQVERDKRTWETADADVQAIVIARYEAEAKRNPALQGVFAEIERAYASMLDEAERRGVGEQVCRNAFARLARGDLRNSTPGVYAAIQRGPDAE